MALAYRLNGRRHIVYAVVLGQRGGNVLDDGRHGGLRPGEIGRELVRPTSPSPKGAVLGTIGFGKDVVAASVSRARVTCTGGTNTTTIR